ncbi:MAG: LysR family transcriptional regulator [Thermoleophilaceae bacterium]
MSGSIPRWSGVQIRHLAALIAVHEHRSFRAAASSLGYVQSAVSQQVGRLEEIVGTRLVERSRGVGEVTLTAAGDVFMEHAEAVMSRLRDAQAELNALSTGTAARLRVGLFQSAPLRLLPPILREFSMRFPNNRIASRESASDVDLFGLVKGGELDVAFADMPLQSGPFESCELMVDPYVLLVEAGSPVAAAGGPPTLGEIAELPLIRQPQWRMTLRIEMELRAAGAEPRFVSSCDSTSAIQALVSAGAGAAVVRRSAVDPQHQGTKSFDLADLPPTRLALFWHSTRAATPALESFREVASRVCGRLYGDRHVESRPLPLVHAAG